jgi:phage baseplate assembly protein W
MAIELGKINVDDLSENNYKVLGIGINRTSNSNGIFSVNYTTLSQAKDNIINLVMTSKGEREMNPNFGCDVWQVLFEPIIDETISQKIEDSILDAVKTWLPYIEIQQIIFDYDSDDIDANKILLEIQFSLAANPSLSDTITLKIEK